MMHGFPTFVVGGVLIAPFVLYAGAAAVIYVMLWPVLRFAGLEHWFSNPPIAGLCIYIVILASLIVLF